MNCVYAKAKGSGTGFDAVIKLQLLSKAVQIILLDNFDSLLLRSNAGHEVQRVSI